VGKTEGRWTLGSPRRRKENNIKIDLREVLSGIMDWIDLARCCECSNKLSDSIKCE
jgi:hypothetical protein